MLFIPTFLQVILTAKFEKLKYNFSWFYSNYDMIEKDIRNQYVAVKDRKHIDNDVGLEAIIKDLI